MLRNRWGEHVLCIPNSYVSQHLLKELGEGVF